MHMVLQPRPGALLHKCGALTQAVSSSRRNLSTASYHRPTVPSEETPVTAPDDLAPDYKSMTPRLVVFGGSGYVGTRVCEQGLGMGASIVSVSRSGGPPKGVTAAWADRVDWVKGDVFDPQAPWRALLKGATGVVSTLGAFGSNAFMYKVCGEANMKLMDEAAAAAVPRFAFISVHEYKLPRGWHAKDFLLSGYFGGKRAAEAHLAQTFPGGGVALRPTFIYGSRNGVPLNLIGAPLEAVLKFLPTRRLASVPIVGAAFAPPVSVDAVAKAAVTAVLDPAVPPGPMDVWEIAKYK